MDHITLIFVLLCFFFTLPTLLILKSLQQRKTPNLTPPPGPRPLPIIGNFHQLGSAPLHESFAQLSCKYGPLLYLKLGSRNFLIANSVKTAEEILRTQDLNFCSRPKMVAPQKLSYDCLDIAFSPYNEYWREIRKTTVLHLLSTKMVQSFSRIREEEVRRMVDMLSEHAKRSEVVDLSARIMLLTSTIVTRVAFGKWYESGTSESKNFHRMVHVFERSLSCLYFGDYFPWLGWLDKLVGKIDRLDEAFRICDEFYQELIDEHLCSDRTKSMEETDMIDILLQLREDRSFNIDLDNIKAMLMDLYFASTDTVGTTITLIMTALIKNPRAMKKAQAEIRSSMKGKHDQVNEKHLASVKLPYLNAAIKEAMRLYTTVPLLLPRETIKESIVNGYEIPAKTLVYVNVWAISKDPDLWEDPDQFLPERFLQGGKKSGVDLKGTDIELTPFGAGRRSCPGITMALSVIEITVANLIYHFDWELPDGKKNEELDDELQDGLTLHRKNPLYLVPKIKSD